MSKGSQKTKKGSHKALEKVKPLPRKDYIQKYTKNKEEIIELVRKGYKVPDLIKEYDIPRATAYDWMKRAYAILGNLGEERMEELRNKYISDNIKDIDYMRSQSLEITGGADDAKEKAIGLGILNSALKTEAEFLSRMGVISKDSPELMVNVGVSYKDFYGAALVSKKDVKDVKTLEKEKK